MAFSNSNNTDARGCTFNDVHRDQNLITVITKRTNNIIISGSAPQQIRDALRGIIDLDDDIQSIFNTEKTTGTTTKKQDQKPDENFPKIPLPTKEPAKHSEPEHLVFRWIKPNLGLKHSLLYGINLEPRSSTKVAVFDLNDTLIKQMHWSKLTEEKWEWWIPTIPSKLKEVHDTGYSVVIISNQAQRVQAALKAWEGKKVPSIAAALPDVPFRIFGAKEKDGFRKPMPGIWYELERIFEENGVQIDKKASFFVGDAAGRPKDYSSSDRKWAINVGIQFFTPEEYFLKQSPAPYDLLGWKVSDISNSPLFTPTNTPLLPAPSKSSKPEVILFVGYPCLGKTTFYHRHIQLSGYKHVSQVILKRRDKCVQAVEEALAAGDSCVVDNTNRDVKTRKYYVDIAEKLGLPIRCFKFDGSAELAWHNNLYRAYNMSPSTAAALESFDPKQDLYPYFAISGYEKNYEEPTISEGFSEIKTIHWVFDGDAEAERRWSMWLQIDDKKQVQRS